MSPETRKPGEPVTVRAAGAVVWAPRRQVLLVHRPKYDDWSFPKGKLERGEHPTSAAVREVAEETGLHVRLGVPLPEQHYTVARGAKTVHYWNARVVGSPDISGYTPNDEVDRLEWLPEDQAMSRLSYPHDAEALGIATSSRRRTRALIIVRHGAARSRKSWRGDDRKRPLLASGMVQAQALAPVLAAYDVRTLITSSSTRCVQTLTPYAQVTGWALHPHDALSEEDATSDDVRRVVRPLLDRPSVGEQGGTDGSDRPDHGVAVCTHRPVLPEVFEAVGLADPRLEPGELIVLHLRKGLVLATERHLVG